MKSGLEGRNNIVVTSAEPPSKSLNEVRPRRPEQLLAARQPDTPFRPVSMKSGLEGRNNVGALVPGQRPAHVSMKSGLEGRNNR